MRKQHRLALAVGLACGAWLSSTALAATQADINAAIDDGLAYLSNTQNTTTGYWTAYGGTTFAPAVTGGAVFALLSQKSQWDPALAAGYQAQVDQAMAFLLSRATTQQVSERYADPFHVNICPGGSGTCTAIYWPSSGEETYTAGLIAPAIALYAAGKADEVATSSGPLAGMTWKQIAQGITNTFAAAQASAATGSRWGGWRYGLPQNADADSSTTQWASIALLYNETLGAVTPQVTKDDLKNHWLPAVQAADGAACYQPGVGPCDHSDTGGLLLSLAFTGGSSTQIQNALTFLNNNWNQNAYGTWYGNFGHPYAMWGVYKGLETTIGLGDTTAINVAPGACGVLDDGTACNWWQDYGDWLVTNQNADGGWDGYGYWYGPMAASFFLPILGGTIIPGPSVPEPATIGLIALGLIGLASVRRRKAA